uniref:Uncharacterized protein n=1 Tax=Loxodonta africana TaxID=9785 RepID=G3TYU3_LOXAF
QERLGSSNFLDLANQSLLQDEALAITALEPLLTELFLPLFIAAVTGRHSQTLTAMVQAWPFTHLPLGALMKAQQPHRDILKAALDRLHVLLAQKVCLRRSKLKVLDLCSETYGLETGPGTVCAHLRKERPLSPRLTSEGCRIQVLIEDLCFKKASQNELTFLVKRVKQRKCLQPLCCRKLEFVDMPLIYIRKIPKTVQLDCVQEVKVIGTWDLFTLATFPHLDQMASLNRLCLSRIINYFIPWVAEEVEMLVAQFTPHLLSLHQLDSVFFLVGHSDQVLRYLKPLKTLSITNCLLLEFNLTYLSSYQSTNHIKYLNFSDVSLICLSPEFLQVLLERSSLNLHCLEIDGCGITDYQLTAILPALGHCSQLTTFSFRVNPVSMAALGSLHTPLLSKFRLGLFPMLLECYVCIQGTLNLGNLQGYLAEVRLILQQVGCPNSVSLFSDSNCTYKVIIFSYDLIPPHSLNNFSFATEFF